MNYSHELTTALNAARAAGELIRNEYESFVPIPDAPVSISTHADKAAQDLIISLVAAAFPNDAICAEESTESLQEAKHTAPRVWVIDPIDGTRGFAMKNGQFSVMIGLTVDREPVVGVVYEPIPDRMTYASKGGGCFAQLASAAPVSCRVSTQTKLNEATLVKSHGKPGKTAPEITATSPAKVIETYSAGVKLAMIARGEADFYPNTYSKFADWDICAGHILVSEAGGNATKLNGEALSYGAEGFAQTGGILATNGKLHAAVVERMKGVQ
ncbi:MAG: 3'(2'),5'-bisphosphate nucleotidase CysQ [Gemmataceae bacterium]